MTSAKSYARAYLAATTQLDPSERLAWLMAFRARTAQRALIRVLQSRDAATAFATLNVPTSIARFLQVLAEDRALGRLSVIIEQALTLAFEAGDGVAVRLTTAHAIPLSRIEEIQQALTGGSVGPVLVEFAADPRVLGGFRAEAADLRLDRTFAHRLAGLNRALVNAREGA